MPRGGSRAGSGQPKKVNLIRDDRTRNWNIIVYPESAPENWRDVIDKLHIEWVESPLHDRDLNETADDDVEKKPHWHCTLLFEGNKSFTQIKEITDSINAPIPKKCASVKGSIRYMVHKDNPDKFQYNWYEIKCHGGADLEKLCAPTFTERQVILGDIADFILDNDVYEMKVLSKFIRENGLSDWFNIVTSCNTLYINSLLSSQRHSRKSDDTDVQNENIPKA
jgi:hypothetical protein